MTQKWADVVATQTLPELNVTQNQSEVEVTRPHGCDTKKQEANVHQKLP